MKVDSDKEGYYAAVLFLIWPLLALISSFKNYRKPWAKNILWAFVAFFGYSFAVGAESVGMDIFSYIQEYQSLHNRPVTFDFAVSYFQNSGEIDILRTLIALILSRFTDAPEMLTLVYGIIFGFFFSRNIWFVLTRLSGKLQWITMLLMAVFFLTIPIWEINGFRMWTAAHVFAYGTFRYLYDKEYSGLIYCISSIMVHFSFVVPVAVLLIYTVLGNFITPYFIFFVATFMISEIDIVAFNTFVESYAPEVLQERTASYRNEDYVELSREGPQQELNWYVMWHSRLLNWATLGYFGLIFFRFKDELKENQQWMALFCFLLIFFGVANILSTLPSGGRFVNLATFLAWGLITIITAYQTGDRWMKKYHYVALPAIVLFILVKVRMGLLSTSASTIMGNPIISYFYSGENISMNDVLRMIL